MLFSISGTYTAKALSAMRANPTTSRAAAFEQLVTTAGGKVVGIYFTMADGPGALTIIDADPVTAAAITGTIAESDGLHDVKMSRLWSEEEVINIRNKRAQIHGSYKAPGQ